MEGWRELSRNAVQHVHVRIIVVLSNWKSVLRVKYCCVYGGKVVYEYYK